MGFQPLQFHHPPTHTCTHTHTHTHTLCSVDKSTTDEYDGINSVVKSIKNNWLLDGFPVEFEGPATEEEKPKSKLSILEVKQLL